MYLFKILLFLSRLHIFFVCQFFGRKVIVNEVVCHLAKYGLTILDKFFSQVKCVISVVIAIIELYSNQEIFFSVKYPCFSNFSKKMHFGNSPATKLNDSCKWTPAQIFVLIFFGICVQPLLRKRKKLLLLDAFTKPSISS